MIQGTQEQAGTGCPWPTSGMNLEKEMTGWASTASSQWIHCRRVLLSNHFSSFILASSAVQVEKERTELASATRRKETQGQAALWTDHTQHSHQAEHRQDQPRGAEVEALWGGGTLGGQDSQPKTHIEVLHSSSYRKHTLRKGQNKNRTATFDRTLSLRNPPSSPGR